jgi:hypothetical protein
MKPPIVYDVTKPTNHRIIKITAMVVSIILDLSLFPSLCYLLLFFGTLAPDLRASDSPIAIACLRLLTFLPLRPDFSWPCLYSCIALLTFCFDLARILALKGVNTFPKKMKTHRFLKSYRSNFEPSIMTTNLKKLMVHLYLGRSRELSTGQNTLKTEMFYN